ncbi:MAG: hypothetical protein JJ920_18865 [Roseitalea sp.]|nr:hypothetical protein [Roseitalea sp.]MBO6722227.1 hypothetical protein [Roseitalea sp.]MBO6744981.1 hypothetical protein [Roseitalea sp.]
MSDVTTKTPLAVRRGLARLLPVALALAGCTSTSTIDTAFSGIGQPAATTAVDPLPDPSIPAAQQPLVPVASSGGPVDRGVFPNVNNEPAPAPNQITEAERAAMMAEMQALQAELDAGRVPTEDSQARLAELQRLAATHSDEVLRRIEGEP